MLWIVILGGLLIMMGQHDRSEALFYYFRLEDQVPETHLLRLIVRPIRVHHFLLTHSGHQEETEVQTLLWIASRKELFQFLLVVDFRLLLRVSGPVSRLNNPFDVLSLEE